MRKEDEGKIRFIEKHTSNEGFIRQKRNLIVLNFETNF